MSKFGYVSGIGSLHVASKRLPPPPPLLEAICFLTFHRINNSNFSVINYQRSIAKLNEQRVEKY
jgi:hypothetical protein